MDVRCPRCGTEYEFDDALVSARGTTVKCTNCTLQFKVRASASQSPERWVVQRRAGGELVFTALRELQHAILQGRVTQHDVLSRGAGPGRPLATIAEFEPFFGTGAAGTGAAVSRTLSGIAPPAKPGALAPRPEYGPLPPLTPPPARVASTPPPAGLARHAGADELPTLPFNERPELRAAPEAQGPAPAVVATAFEASRAALHQRLEPRAEQPPPPERAAVPAPQPVVDAAPAAPRAPAPTPAALAEAELPREALPLERGFPRWLLAVGGLAAVGLAAFVLARSGALTQARPAASSPAPSAASPAQGQVAELLAKATAAVHDGDLELAKEQLDRASALAEGQPAVLEARAELAVHRADLVWLELRLLDPKDEALVTATHRELGRLVGRAQQAVDELKRVAPEAPLARRTAVDLARFNGDVSGAQKLAAALVARAEEPAVAFSLAALELSQPAPKWAEIIERLRVAASKERGLGKARAALAYALLRSGEARAAELELGKLEALTHGGSLATRLAAFIKRGEATPNAAEAAVVDPSQLPKLDTAQRPEERDTADFRAQLTQASSALARKQWDRAEELYRAVLAKDPGNTEALAGLGDVARGRKDPSAAGDAYEKVLAENPNYLPALIGQADQKWDAGDRKGALAIYRRVLDSAGASSSYGKRAAARIAQGAASDGDVKLEEEPPKPSPSPSAAPPPAPSIDTSDLPGFGE